jgi:hypothetical protein
MLKNYNETSQPIYKLSLNITNANSSNDTCFPHSLIAEMYNVDHSNMRGKIFKYSLVYLVLTCLQIYLMTYEYLNIISVPVQ